MDAVESFLLCAVAVSVLMFLLLDILDSIEKSSRTFVRVCDSGRVVGVGGERIVVGGDCETVEEEIPEIVGQIAEEEKDMDDGGDPVTVGEEEEIPENREQIAGEEDKKDGVNPITVGCSGPEISVDDCRQNLGVREDDEIGGEEEFIDDWEGIERTELERDFGEAVVYVNSKCGGDGISGDVKLELDGLQRVALEGPCCGSQPMAFNVLARSKWKAWQKLGDMTRETAMESYIEILSKAIPKWKVVDKLTIQNAAIREDLNPSQQSVHGNKVER